MSTRPRPAMLAVAFTIALAASSVLALPTAAADPVVTVQPGDTLSEIAASRGYSVTEVAAVNGLRDADHILVGQRLRLPAAPPATKPAPAAASPAAPAAAAVSHRVAASEHLTGIAARYGTTVSAIAAANGLADPSYIRAGQVLSIPGATTSATAPAGSNAPAARLVTRRMPAEMAALVSRREAIGKLIVAESLARGVDPALALALAWQESGWQTDIVSWGGAVGVMQLLPATADWVGTTMLGETVDPRDPRSNVRAGVTLLKHYLDRYGGDRILALAAYYQGQTAVDRHGVYAVSRPYIASILALRQLFAG